MTSTERVRKWRLTHDRKPSDRKYYQLHKLDYAIRGKSWRSSHREQYLAIRKNRKARLRGAIGLVPAYLWNLLKEICGNRCVVCGENKPLTQDHIIPVVMGGKHEISNLQPVCQSCNCKKYTKAIDYRPAYVRWAMVLG